MVENQMLLKAFETRSDVFKAVLKETGIAETNTGWEARAKASGGTSL